MGNTRAGYQAHRDELETLNDLAADAAASGDPARCREVAEKLADFAVRVRSLDPRLIELKSQAAEIELDLRAVASGKRRASIPLARAEGAD